MSDVIVDTLTQREDSVRSKLGKIKELYYQAGDEIRSLFLEEVWVKRGFNNWNDYCQATWGVTNSYASRLMAAAGVYATLPEGLKPANESVARELRDYPTEVRIPAMQIAAEVAGEGRVTAELVKRAVKVAAMVAEEALASHGYVESEDGQQQPLRSSITKEMFEAMLRQSEHIATRSNRIGVGYFAATAQAVADMTALYGIDLSNCDPNEPIYVRLYRDKPDDDNN